MGSGARRANLPAWEQSGRQMVFTSLKVQLLGIKHIPALPTLYITTKLISGLDETNMSFVLSNTNTRVGTTINLKDIPWMPHRHHESMSCLSFQTNPELFTSYYIVSFRAWRHHGPVQLHSGDIWDSLLLGEDVLYLCQFSIILHHQGLVWNAF